MLRRFFRPRRCRVRVAAEPVTKTPEPELYNTDAAGESYFGQVSTFAEVSSRSRKSSEQTIVKVVPYFGPFEGREVVFCIVHSRTLVRVDGEKISTQLDLTRSPRHGHGSVRDTCINFVHDAGRCGYDLPCPQPKSLQFLCKKHIHLSGVLPSGMPLREAKKFESQSTKQSLTVRVWPSDVLRTGASSQTKNAVKLRVPVHLSFGELGWFLRDKVSLPSSCCVSFREPDGIYDLQPSHPLMLRHTALDCFVKTNTPSPPQVFTASPRPVLLPVMLVGCGVEEVVITHAMTVVEFEHAVVQQFGLSDECFLYIPALFSQQVRYSTGLKMYTNASRRSGMALLDRHARHFPIVSDNDLNLRVEYRELTLYNRTVREAGLLQDKVLLCFSVTGPTVPLCFKAISSNISGHSTSSSSSSSANDSSGANHRSANFVSITIEPRVISINPTWTVSTLLKYVDCVSHFSNRKLLLNDTVVSSDTVIGKLFDRDWIVQSPKGGRTVSPNVLRAI